MSQGIQDLIAAPVAKLALDMGQGSREQSFAEAPKRVLFILSEQARPHGEGAADD